MVPDRWAAAAHGCGGSMGQTTVTRLAKWSPEAADCLEALDECASPQLSVRFLNDGAWPESTIEYCPSDPPSSLLRPLSPGLLEPGSAPLAASAGAWKPKWKQHAVCEDEASAAPLTLSSAAWVPKWKRALLLDEEQVSGASVATAATAALETTAPMELSGSEETEFEEDHLRPYELDETAITLLALPEWITLLGGGALAAVRARVLMAQSVRASQSSRSRRATHEIHVDRIRPDTVFEHKLAKLWAQKSLKMHLKGNVGGVSHGKSSLRCKHSARFPTVRRREAKC